MEIPFKLPRIRLSAWRKKTKAGDTYLSLSLNTWKPERESPTKKIEEEEPKKMEEQDDDIRSKNNVTNLKESSLEFKYAVLENQVAEYEQKIKVAEKEAIKLRGIIEYLEKKLADARRWEEF